MSQWKKDSVVHTEALHVHILVKCLLYGWKKVLLRFTLTFYVKFSSIVEFYVKFFLVFQRKRKNRRVLNQRVFRILLSSLQCPSRRTRQQDSPAMAIIPLLWLLSLDLEYSMKMVSVEMVECSNLKFSGVLV